MTANEIKNIIVKGENINVEFKTAYNKLNKDIFDTICSFLNRNGGTLFLGVKDDGTINGINENALQSISDAIVASLNNSQKLHPTYYLLPHKIEIDGKKIIYLKIPESSQVHNTAGKIFDRNEDGDFDISNQYEQVKQMYNRKSNIFTENTIYSYLKYSDMRPELIDKVRRMATNIRANHPWQNMTNEELLKSARLHQTNYQTGETGYTLAAALLFGKDEVIQSILPAYKTDALVRINNTDRYDDRDEVRTNLIDSYERLIQFIRKHLPDPFYLEGDRRISLREAIFREAIVNTLIHREYTNSFPARLIIEKYQVSIENWNLPVKHGLISPDLFYTHPKNPNILQVFKEIKLADELGSGVRNIYKYSKLYSNGKLPEIIEENTFKTIMPLAGKIIMGINGEVNADIDKLYQIIRNAGGKNTQDLAIIIQKPYKTVEKWLKKLKDNNKIEFIGPAKTGGYYLKIK